MTYINKDKLRNYIDDIVEIRYQNLSNVKYNDIKERLITSVSEFISDNNSMGNDMEMTSALRIINAGMDAINSNKNNLEIEQIISNEQADIHQVLLNESLANKIAKLALNKMVIDIRENKHTDEKFKILARNILNDDYFDEKTKVIMMQVVAKNLLKDDDKLLQKINRNAGKLRVSIFKEPFEDTMKFRVFFDQINYLYNNHNRTKDKDEYLHIYLNAQANRLLTDNSHDFHLLSTIEKVVSVNQELKKYRLKILEIELIQGQVVCVYQKKELTVSNGREVEQETKNIIIIEDPLLVKKITSDLNNNVKITGETLSRKNDTLVSDYIFNNTEGTFSYDGSKKLTALEINRELRRVNEKYKSNINCYLVDEYIEKLNQGLLHPKEGEPVVLYIKKPIHHYLTVGFIKNPNNDKLVACLIDSWPLDGIRIDKKLESTGLFQAVVKGVDCDDDGKFLKLQSSLKGCSTFAIKNASYFVKNNKNNAEMHSFISNEYKNTTEISWDRFPPFVLEAAQSMTLINKSSYKTDIEHKLDEKKYTTTSSGKKSINILIKRWNVMNVIF